MVHIGRVPQRKLPSTPTFRKRLLLSVASLLAAIATTASAQQPLTTFPTQYGPYNGNFIAAGIGLREPLPNTRDSLLLADTPWTLYCWINPSDPIQQRQLVAGIGYLSSEYPRYLAINAHQISLWMGTDNELSGNTTLAPGKWQFIAATFDGKTFHLYSGGNTVATGNLTLGSADPLLQIAPAPFQPQDGTHFAGKIAAFTVLRQSLSHSELQQLASTPPDFSVAEYEDGSKPWPFQTRGQAGYDAPQDPNTMPVSRAPFSQPQAIKRPPAGPSLTASAPGQWAFTDGWDMQPAPKVQADPAAITQPSFHPTGWLRASVPGTVLTTMIDDGIYPDPDFGLNNMAIPESLNKQDYWYRNEFTLPDQLNTSGPAHHIDLTFQGINYHASIWLNGTHLGDIKGAFDRGIFDVTSALKPGQKNVLAVRISPPPHPGIPNEQSILGGPGGNGGQMELDGPTFLATEGWDWIPAIRDRDSGIWQPVTLTLTGDLKIGDAQIVTSFPHHDYTHANLDITIPAINLTDKPIRANLTAQIEAITIHKAVTLPPGSTQVKLTPADFPQLRMNHPRLWWPNGYGKPNLYHLKLSLADTTIPSDSKDIRFGVREITYELSLIDNTGHLRRVEFSPTDSPDPSTPVVDVSHSGMLPIPSADGAALNIAEEKRDGYLYHTVVASIAPGADNSPALTPDPDTAIGPYLAIKVNGVRIAVRGGNWGMDDSRKRVSRAHLEPFFRLNRDANLNIIRNWVGQNTEETFYDLADEYGMLVWNDFWESTENYNIEAQDPALFLKNAADTITRFRNHPSIVLWCGRNEGVPQPIINMGLDNLVRTLDGTRYYSPSSNQVNLQGSGPYSYHDPSLYYTELNRGFSVETGTPSMSTLESFESTIAKPDQWPISDAWAYHDWHQSGNGDTKPFMDEMQAEFGAPTSLPDFERKAQMLNYIDYRAIFEGMNANLWSPNSGRLLWMTQPAWPSTMWQILSSDYDTQASFYGTKTACEPLHIQLNLATYQVNVINTTTTPQPSLTASAKVYSLTNKLLFQTTSPVSLTADAAANSIKLDLAPYLAQGIVLVDLNLTDTSGKPLSHNLYWLGQKSSSYRDLTRLPQVQLTASATSRTAAETTTVTVQLTNPGTTVSLNNKLTLLSTKDHTRILPAYYSDNYISLLPGESRTIQIEYPTADHTGAAELTLRGWNLTPTTTSIHNTN
ncbi:MAG: glycoside hydrolase family 2 [Acidobacteria bacterium]|nr:glycoside hydrolase family 2 [Acidobacteriota bacterium]